MRARKETNMKTNLEPQASLKEQGFTLLELMVALVVTLVITGSMWGLMASGQGSFRREPALMDRQQQIRIAMTRIREDVQNAGLGLGNFFQAFAENLNGVGMPGVRVVGDPNLGGGASDFLEIRQQGPDCPKVRSTNRTGVVFQIAENPLPACLAIPGWVVGFYPDGNAKWGWAFNVTGQGFNVPGGQQPGVPGQPGSSQMHQFPGNANLQCSIDMATNGGVCPPANNANPVAFGLMNQVRYQLGNDVDGVPSLFRSDSGGFNAAAGAFSNPPGPAWQLVARGIEDLQVRYRVSDAAGNPVWQNNAPAIVAPSFDNVVREVEITMWARTVGENQLQGQTLAAGNQVTAVRGSLVSSVSPRAAQVALMQELDPNKRWQ